MPLMHFTVNSANLFIHSRSHLFKPLRIKIVLIVEAKKTKTKIRYGLSVLKKLNPEKEVSQEKNLKTNFNVTYNNHNN